MLPALPKSHSLSNSTPFPSDFYPTFHPDYHPSMDPAAVDFRAFYPYTPNEVKHRKRTTSAQLKILEGVFKRDTKPNAQLRSELATQLEMTPRGVQVWFQNRRAKEKTKAGKAAKAAAAEKRGEQDTSSSQPSPDANTNTEPSSAESDLHLKDATSESPSPAVPSPSPSQLTSSSTDPASWQNSPLPTPEDSTFMPGVHHDGHLLRRGSLPGNVFLQQSDNHSFGPSLSGHMDPYARRRSVDASLHSLASNPYASLTRAKNSGLYGSRISRLSTGGSRFTPPNTTSSIPSPLTRPPLPHVLTTPDQQVLPRTTSSMESRPYRFGPNGAPISPSPSPLSSYHAHAIRNSLPDNNLYAFSSRTVPSPIPGPLPSADFSFGVATANVSSSLTSPDSERASPDPFSGYRFRRDELDCEDDGTGTSGSYDAFSRFGSLASIATNSSNTSAYYSEVGSCPADPHDIAGRHSRDNSCSSNQFLGLMSGLDVSGPSRSFEDGLVPPPSADNAATSSYPSPSSGSTVSPGSGSPSINNEIPPEKVSSVSSSELAFALQDKSESTKQIPFGHHSDPPLADAGSGVEGSSTFFYSPQASYPAQVPPAPPMEFNYDNGAAADSGLNYSSASPEIYASQEGASGFSTENAAGNMEYAHGPPYHSTTSRNHSPNASYSSQQQQQQQQQQAEQHALSGYAAETAPNQFSTLAYP